MIDKERQVNQTISGNGHQIAGRDVVNINKGDGFRPNPNNPNLITCPACKRPGIYRNADMCECKYSFEKARLQHQQELETKFWLGVMVVFCALGYMYHISQQLGTGFPKTLIVSLMILGLTWFVGKRLWANAIAWVDEYRQKRNRGPGDW